MTKGAFERNPFPIRGGGVIRGVIHVSTSRQHLIPTPLASHQITHTHKLPPRLVASDVYC